MSPTIIIITIVASFLWLLRYRFQDNFLRAYGFFFLILVVYSTNKAYYGISADMSESMLSPLSLVRWGLLFVFAWFAWRTKMPGGFRSDVAMVALSVLLLADMLASAFYAADFNYSFLRAISFVLLAFAVMKGMTFHLFNSVNCLRFFQLKYYTAWIMIAPALLMLLSGLGYGITIIANQYAGFFGNQNMYGAFSALIIPYVLFHWRAVAQKKWEKWADGALLMMIFIGVWFSNSRNGMLSTVIAVSTYFFVINLQSRIKIVAAAICVLLALAISPTLQNDLLGFVRKGMDKTTQVEDLSSQLTQEERVKMWTGVLPEFWKRKLTGYGFAASHLLVFPFTRDEEAGRMLHNSYLEVFGDLGLPGMILLFLIIVRIGAKAVGLIQTRGEPFERHINAVFISVFAAGTINAFFESWMFSVGNLTSLMYWAPVAGIVARWAWQPATVREALKNPITQMVSPVGKLQPQLGRK